MELMSCLLLCALVAMVPQALGNPRRKFPYGNGYNDTIIIRRKMNSIGKNIIVHKPNQFSKFKDLQSLFMDPDCKGCYVCMEKALSAKKPHMHMMDPRISAENFQEDHDLIDASRRDKRETDNKSGRKYKRSKPKKNNGVTVLKYNENGKIFALKVKETNTVFDLNNKSKTVTSCQVHSVQNSFSCESPEANLILTESRKKRIKKSKKVYGKRETKTVGPTKMFETTKPVIAPFYRKSYVDDSYYIDQIMPSIEEMY